MFDTYNNYKQSSLSFIYQRSLALPWFFSFLMRRHQRLYFLREGWGDSYELFGHFYQNEEIVFCRFIWVKVGVEQVDSEVEGVFLEQDVVKEIKMVLFWQSRKRDVEFGWSFDDLKKGLFQNIFYSLFTFDLRPIIAIFQLHEDLIKRSRLSVKIENKSIHFCIWSIILLLLDLLLFWKIKLYPLNIQFLSV